MVERPRVAPAVPRVDDDAHSGEAAGLRGRGEEGRLGPLLLPRGGLRVVRREVLLGEELERDLHREADGNPVDVVDARPEGDVQRELDDVPGVEAPGEPHDDGGIERLLPLQAVDGVLPFLVRAVLEARRLLVGNRLGVAERREEVLDGHLHERPASGDGARQPVQLARAGPRGARRP